MVGMIPGTTLGMDGMLLITVMAIIAGMIGDGDGIITPTGAGTIILHGAGTILGIIILIIIIMVGWYIIQQIFLPIETAANVAMPAEATEQAQLLRQEVIVVLLPHVEM